MVRSWEEARFCGLSDWVTRWPPRSDPHRFQGEAGRVKPCGGLPRDDFLVQSFVVVHESAGVFVPAIPKKTGNPTPRSAAPRRSLAR